ncbi:hypothetical protein ACPWSR_02610 [Alloiococcus sp. CFN-8]|uniref:hypothetical protein n=1 Tax=Alloiococcus sp. CFN-8 TaxID=3416081 RepID=UPI003CEB8780
MRKYFFYILVVLSLTTFFGFFTYYGMSKDFEIRLVNEHGDVNNLGNVELKVSQRIDNYRGIELFLNKKGLTKEKVYADRINDELMYKDYKELARGESLAYVDEFLQTDSFQVASILSNKVSPFEYSDDYTHKIIIRNKDNGKIVKNVEEILRNNSDDFFSIDGAAIIDDKLYILMINTYYMGDEYDQQRRILKLKIYDLNSGKKLEEKEPTDGITISEVYTFSEKGNIFFLGSEIRHNGRVGGVQLYKYNIFDEQLEEIEYSKEKGGIDGASSGRQSFFNYSNVREIIEYEDSIYLIDDDNNIICLDKDYKITTHMSIREALREYEKIHGYGVGEILINDDKLYFNWMRDQFMSEDEPDGSKTIVAVISLKDSSVLYYGELISQLISSDKYSWQPLINRGFHIN